jgi:Heparinase II/III-like protein/Heparinase II/III N-terminus
MDFDYYSYLARTIPPREIARALAVRARRALGVPPVFFDGNVEIERQRRRLDAEVTVRPSLIDSSEREAVRKLMLERWPLESEAVLHEGREARKGSMLLFGQWKKCGQPIDYHSDPMVPGVKYDAREPGDRVNLFQPGADAKVMWEVGRLQHLLRYGQARWLTGDKSWSSAWEKELEHFRATNPAGFGVQWSCAMEVSLRACNIALSYAMVSDEVAAGPVIDLLEEHCEYVSRHLEETGAIRTNHYAADLVGLVVCGALFPELTRWHDSFARRLWDEIPRQVRADGTHFEASIGYQRLCAEMFLLAVLAAREAGKPAPQEVQQAVLGLFRSLGQLAKPSGDMPQIGDLDSCRALPLVPREALESGFMVAIGSAAFGDPTLASGDCPAEVVWLLGLAGLRRYSPRANGQGSVQLRDAGIAVLRSEDAWLCLSAGPNGQGGTGGHAHNDKNSVELSFGGVNLLVDRGTYVYARDPAERNARRGTAGHSTLQVDGLEQNRIVPGRLFALPDTAKARVTGVATHEGYETAEGEHTGYARIGVEIHRRKVALSQDAAVVADELIGSGEHAFVSRLYIPHTQVSSRAATPAEAARLEELHQAGFAFGFDLKRCVLVRDSSGAEIALFAFGATLPWTLSLDPSDVSPGYLEKRPATRVKLELFGNAPARIFTAVLRLPPAQREA